MDIKEIITDNTDTLDEIDDYGRNQEKVIEGYTIKLAEEYGGEGMGDCYFKVFSFEKDGDIEHWKIPGYYSSGYGSELEWYNAFKVKQVEKLIQVWVDFETGQE